MISNYNTRRKGDQLSDEQCYLLRALCKGDTLEIWRNPETTHQEILMTGEMEPQIGTIQMLLKQGYLRQEGIAYYVTEKARQIVRERAGYKAPPICTVPCTPGFIEVKEDATVR